MSLATRFIVVLRTIYDYRCVNHTHRFRRLSMRRANAKKRSCHNRKYPFIFRAEYFKIFCAKRAAIAASGRFQHVYAIYAVDGRSSAKASYVRRVCRNQLYVVLSVVSQIEIVIGEVILMKTKQYFMYLFRKFQWMIANIVAVLVFSVLLQKFFAPDPAAISPDSYILSPTQAYPKDIPARCPFPNFMTPMAWELAGLVFEASRLIGSVCSRCRTQDQVSYESSLTVLVTLWEATLAIVA